MVIEASTTKAPIARVADKISGYFVPSVIIIAIITFIIYIILGFNITTSIMTFVSILVVACPCSLGLATPLAIVISEGLCATNGILVKKSEVLENASKIDAIVFDKTGTLTYGKLKFSKMYNYSELSDEEILKLVGSIESKSTHPISKAFIDYIEENNLKKVEVHAFEDLPGLGVTGKIQEETFILGNSKIVSKYNIINNHKDDEKKLSSDGNSIIYVIKDYKIIALIGVNDIVRKNAREVIKELSDDKIETIMLTGDNKETANIIGKELGITEVISNVLPKEKADIIKKLKSKDKYVLMCGDGINDSPALANADIGVSIKSSTDIAMDSADVILTRNDLRAILELINISKDTVKNIKQNLFWAFLYNSLMIPIAAGVFKPRGISINPMIASLAMVFSSISVIINALRLKKIKI